MKTRRFSLVFAALIGLCFAPGTVLLAQAGTLPGSSDALGLAEGSSKEQIEGESPRSQVGLSIGLAVSLPALPYGDFTTYVGPVIAVIRPLSKSLALGAWACGALCVSGSFGLQASAGPTVVLGNVRTFGVSVSPGAGLFFVGGYSMFFLDARVGLYFRGFFVHLAWVAWLGSGIKVDAGYTLDL